MVNNYYLGQDVGCGFVPDFVGRSDGKSNLWRHGVKNNL
jgi:hypothetical protein